MPFLIGGDAAAERFAEYSGDVRCRGPFESVKDGDVRPLLCRARILCSCGWNQLGSAVERTVTFGFSHHGESHRDLFQVPGAAVIQGDLQIVAVDHRWAIELGQFASRHVSRDIRIREQRSSLGREGETAGYVGGRDLEAFRVLVEGIQHAAAGQFLALHLFHDLRQVLVSMTVFAGATAAALSLRRERARSPSELSPESDCETAATHSSTTAAIAVIAIFLTFVIPSAARNLLFTPADKNCNQEIARRERVSGNRGSRTLGRISEVKVSGVRNEAARNGAHAQTCSVTAGQNNEIV